MAHYFGRMFLSLSTLDAVGVDGTTMLGSTEANDVNLQFHSAFFPTLGYPGRECKEGIWVYGYIAHLYLRLSQAYATMFGYLRCESLGMSKAMSVRKYKKPLVGRREDEKT